MFTISQVDKINSNEANFNNFLFSYFSNDCLLRSTNSVDDWSSFEPFNFTMPVGDKLKIKKISFRKRKCVIKPKKKGRLN